MSTYRDAAVAAEIRKVFPKHNKTAYSLAKRTSETGVMLCPKAREIAALYLGQKRKPAKRKNPYRIYGRLPMDLAEKVKAKLGDGSMQDLLLMLLTEWVERKPYVPAQMEVLYPGDPGYDEAKGAVE
jgi:hypothetical protein